MNDEEVIPTDTAINELLRLANAQMRLVGKPLWTRREVQERPHDAGWCAHAFAARCVRAIEAGT